jgi:hypothetical protein
MVLGLMALLLPGTGCGGETVRGSGVVTMETRDVKAFTEIALAGSGNVRVERGEKQTLTVEAEDNILPLLETTVKDGKLTLTTRSNVSIRTTKPIVYRITTKALEGVSLSGSGTIEATKVEAKSFAIAISGSGKVGASGKAELAKMTISGSGSIDASDLPATTVTVVISGSGDAVVNATEELDAQIRGSGSIEYIGDPQVNQRVTGSGRIRRRASAE